MTRTISAAQTPAAPKAKPAPPLSAAAERAQDSVKTLQGAGYKLVAASVRTWNWKLTFVGPNAS